MRSGWVSRRFRGFSEVFQGSQRGFNNFKGFQGGCRNLQSISGDLNEGVSLAFQSGNIMGFSGGPRAPEIFQNGP